MIRPILAGSRDGWLLGARRRGEAGPGPAFDSSARSVQGLRSGLRA